MYNTIKQKNKIINIFKIKEGIIDNCNDIEFEKKLEGMKVSLSQENIHFMNNTFNNNNNKDLTFDIKNFLSSSFAKILSSIILLLIKFKRHTTSLHSEKRDKTRTKLIACSLHKSNLMG